MRSHPCWAFALASVVGLGTAYAAPSARGAPASADDRNASATGVDLSLRQSTLARVEREDPLDLPKPRATHAPRGQFVGPIWLDGVYAQHLQSLPPHMRRGMAQPIGPTMLVVETPRIGATGAEGGVYARF